MSIYRLAQNFEIKFWNAVIPVISEEGPLMKTIRSIKQIAPSKPRNIALLILVWAAIGFVSGVILGRLILIFQIL
ncbi:MAG: hypothetical protein K0B06_00825 [Brevefilum sp.]|nr:hypothetical protein [Brevefilum sp.]